MIARVSVVAPLVVACHVSSTGGLSNGGDGVGTSSTSPPTDSESASSGTTASGADDTDANGTGTVFDLGPGPFDLGPGGTDIPTCDDLAALCSTSLGCEFWTAQFGQAGPDFVAELGWGIGIGNPFDVTTTVTLEDRRGPGGALRELAQITLEPFASELISINGASGAVPYENHYVPPFGSTPDVAVRVTSDSPITSMQIEPLGGAQSHYPEASLLLPKNALGDAYYAIGYGDDWAMIAVLATEDDTTVVTPAGTQTLDAFDAFAYSNVEPTGVFIGADKPVAVLSGVRGSVYIPGPSGWADHLEEMVLPLAAWGTAYVGARHPIRHPEIDPTPELVYWRVVAGADDTTISIEPPGVVSGDAIVLPTAGSWFEFATASNFVATAAEDTPFLLVQYMAGGTTVNPDGLCAGGLEENPDDPATGDPYMMQVVPIEQWMASVPFLTDSSYSEDFVLLVREAGTSVSLDCLGVVDDDHFEPIPGTSYEVGTVVLDADENGGEGDCEDGQHRMTADGPVGVMVGGYDCAASYGYPGGLALDALWTPPRTPAG